MKSKAILFALSFVFSAISCFSQEEFMVSWGRVSMSDVTLRECSFEKEATAIVLLDEAMSNYDDEYHLITNRHLRIKIIKEKGIEHATISIPFYRKDDFELISNVEAIIYSPDGSQSTPVERKSIYTQVTNNSYGEVKFTFPNVKVGSIIEYRYQSTMKHYGGLDEWRFQTDLPVLRSYYHLTLLPNSEFAYVVHKSTTLPISIKPNNSGGSISFEMKEVPSLGNEPYMDSRRDYLQRVAFQLSRTLQGRRYMTSWDEMTKELLSETSFGSQLGKDLSGTETFINITKALTSDREKIRIVYDYVRNHMKAVNSYGIYSNDGIKSAWNKKSGSNGEVNLILVNLLRAVGLEAHPMLVSERWHGKVDPKIPLLDQFQTVYACVITNERNYFLDAAGKHTPYDIVPHHILNTYALIVHRKKGGITNITDESARFKELLSISAKIDTEGKLAGEMFMSSEGYAKVLRKEENERKDGNYFVKNFQKSVQGVSFDKYSLKNDGLDTLPLEQKCEFNFPLNSSGDYVFIPLNVFSEFDKNPFVSDRRFSNVNFGFKQSYTINLLVDIPQAFNVDALPKPIRLSDPDKTIVFTRNSQFDQASGKMLCSMTIDCNQSLFEVEDYELIKNFYKKMFEFLAEPVVLKKKTTP